MYGELHMNQTIPEIGKQKRACIAFYNGFLDLMEEKDFEDITVSDIIAAADYSRSAFYSNFLDKDDMLRHMLDYFVLVYVHSTYDTYRDYTGEIKDSLYLPMLNTFRIAYENRRFYHLLFSGRFPGYGLNEFQAATERFFRAAFSVDHQEWPNAFDWDMYWFIKGREIFDFIIYWDRCDWRYTAEYMAKNSAMLLPKVSSVRSTPGRELVIIKDMFNPPNKCSG